MVNSVSWLTLLAGVVMVVATILMIVVDSLFIMIIVPAMLCFVAGNLAIAHHNRQAQIA